MRHVQMQFGQVITPTVKKLIIANVSLWVGGVLIVQNMFFDTPVLFQLFGMSPALVLESFHFWQPATYMFLHSGGVFHILFNMLMLWWLGSEMEQHWGRRFFTAYYFACGIGAAGLYILCTYVYYILSGVTHPLFTPVIGASASVYGLFLAYGLLFGERMVMVFMMFPMKAKHFVLLLGGIELVSLLNSGMRSQVAHLAHLGGIVAGFLFLWGSTHWRRLKREGAFDAWQSFKPGWPFRKTMRRRPRLTVVRRNIV